MAFSRLALLFLFCAGSLCLGRADSNSQAADLYRTIRNAVSPSRLKTDLASFASNAARIAGTPGDIATLAYSESQLRNLGCLNVHRETFHVTVPDPASRGQISGPGWKTELYPMWPNLVRTSTCSLRGKLIYGRNGTLQDLSAKEIQGNVVVLEFNSQGNWRNAAKLGAAAIIFVEPNGTTRAEAEQKFSSVPLNVPRFYLPIAKAAPLLKSAFEQDSVSLVCRQDWLKLPASNLIAELPGTDPAANAEPILLEAFSDSMSVVPGLSPGASQSIGLAGLLEALRIIKQRPHRRPIKIVIASGHCEGLCGARELVENMIARNEPLLLALTFDFGSGGSVLGSFGRGWFYDARDESQDPVRIVSQNMREQAHVLADVYGLPAPTLAIRDTVNDADGRGWRNCIPGKFAFDCEPFMLAGYQSLTFATVDDPRILVDTPFDTVDRIDLANVVEQTSKATSFLERLLNDTSSPDETSTYRVPLRTVTPRRMSLTGGFSTLEGNVVFLDPAKSFVPSEPTPHSLAVVLGRENSMMGVRANLIDMTEPASAKFQFHGLPTVSTYQDRFRLPIQTAAFGLDPESGEINFAPAEGIQGSESYPTTYNIATSYKSTPIVVFPCKATDLFDLVDPQDLTAITSLNVMDADTNGAPSRYGLFQPFQNSNIDHDTEDAAVAFLKPDQRFKIQGTGKTGDTRLLLSNANRAHPDGLGYKAGEPLLDLSIKSAADLIAINESRINQFSKYRILSKGVLDLQNEAKSELELALKAKRSQDWEAMAKHARAAWGLSLRAHPVIQSTANDVVNGVVFYLLLLIPFSFFAERLLVASRVLTRQLLWAGSFFVCAFLVLRLIHPAFEIVTNPSMIFVAFVMGTLSVVVIAFILGKFESSLKTVKAEQLGIKEVDVRRMSVAMAAFNLGVNNMRRRKARTFLTTLTLVVMTFIVLSFTSIVPELQVHERQGDKLAPYNGLLLRQPGLDELQTSAYASISNEFAGAGAVARRAYFYGATVGANPICTLRRQARTIDIKAVLGMDPQESQVSRPQQALLPGGRWIQPGDQTVMILPRSVSTALGIGPGEVGRVSCDFAGQPYLIIGILDDAQLRSIRDLDGDGILPADLSLSKQIQEATGSQTSAFRSFQRLDPSVCFIVPVEQAMALGASLRSIAVGFPEGFDTRAAMQKLMPRLRLNLYAGGKSGVSQFSTMQGSKGEGIALIILQLLIASVFVLNTMIASVYERTREIAILSAIGLSPNHISMLFFAEASVYGILGAVLGYFCAQIAAKVIVTTGLLPGLYLNFSSTSAVMSAVIVLTVVFVSTIYPARKASQVAAPALEDDLLDSIPEGDEWTIKLPFSVDQSDAERIVQFFYDWFKAYEEFSIGQFVTSETQIEGNEVSTVAWLAPFDLGVSQRVELRAVPSKMPGYCELDLILRRQSGESASWLNVNRQFLGAIRRQFLTWRALEKAEDQRVGTG